MAGVPHLFFDSADYAVGEARARWEALIGAYDVRLPEGAPPETFWVRSESWLLGDLLVSRGRLCEVELHRSAERVAADGRDTFTFGLVTRGLLDGDFDGRACELRPGQVCVIDFARPWRARSAPADFILVSVPRAPLLARAPHAGDLHGRRLEGAPARILAEHVLALARHLPEAAAADVEVIRRATLRLLAESVDALPDAPPPGPGPAVARVADRVRRHVDANLGAPSLTPQSICEALGLSRPTLYRAFRAGGGVARYIQRRRLEAVHVRLSDPQESRSLAELALDHGFGSHAHFSTAFRRRFGYAPRDVRRHESGPGAAALLFQSWLLEMRAAGQD